MVSGGGWEMIPLAPSWQAAGSRPDNHLCSLPRLLPCSAKTLSPAGQRGFAEPPCHSRGLCHPGQEVPSSTGWKWDN